MLDKISSMLGLSIPAKFQPSTALHPRWFIDSVRNVSLIVRLAFTNGSEGMVSSILRGAITKTAMLKALPPQTMYYKDFLKITLS